MVVWFGVDGNLVFKGGDWYGEHTSLEDVSRFSWILSLLKYPRVWIRSSMLAA